MNSTSVNAQRSVSIGLPVYNGARYLRQALDSLLAQTYTDFELIIGNNASTDETETICLEYLARDSRIRYYRHSRNLGSVANFPFVFEQAQGEFFMWAAHDDLWENDWIEKLHAIVSREEGVMAYGLVRTIDDEGRPLAHSANGRSFRFDQKYPWLRRLYYFLQYEGLGKANLIHGLYRRSDLVRQGFSGFVLQPYADCLYLFGVLSSIKVKSVTQTFHYKRVHASSTANSDPAWASTEAVVYSPLRKIVGLLRTMFNRDAVAGYIAYARGSENVLLLVAAPLKILFTIHGLVLSYLCARDNRARASGFSE